MRLTTIKLAGFKSFVDPTTLHFPTNLTGIVGPNGCGKSNIIDAIRWVMGESTASKLRGDAITDVIFNGSSERKPVAQASVELIFDNGDGSLGGEYARYAEISVKRVVGRDAQSHYYLNGQRCRRRDITDLFLGTGLGPRAYSIIEQGMISAIVESAPEDLRVHLEEAAGISKYKERRKETESRIRATRENLARLDDVRQEVDKQLEHLERQAKQAERYIQLKAERRAVAAAIEAMSWRALDRELAAGQGELMGVEREQAELQARLAELERGVEAARAEAEAAQTALQSAQTESFELAARIAHLEQEDRHARALVERHRAEAAALTQQIERLAVEGERDRRERAERAAQWAAAEPEWQRAKIYLSATQNALAASEARAQEAQQVCDRLGSEHAARQREAEVLRTRIDLLERQTQAALARRQRLLEERAQLDPSAVEVELEQARTALAAAVSAVAAVEQSVAAERRTVQGCRAELEHHGEQRTTLERRLSTARGRLASLEALQQAALGQDGGARSAWLAAHGLGDAPRLTDVLRVEPGYERAVETVLDDLLEAVVVESEALAADRRPPSGVLWVLAAGDANEPVHEQSLAARVAGPAAVRTWLARVRVFETAAEAAAWAATAAPGDSAVSRDGQWFGPDWVRWVGPGAAHDGVLLRARAIETLRAEITADEQRMADAGAALATARTALAAAEAEHERLQQELYHAHRRSHEAQGLVERLGGRQQAMVQRVQTLGVELHGLESSLSEEAAAILSARATLGETLETMAELERRRADADRLRQEARVELEQARHAVRQARESAHQRELEVAAQRLRIDSLDTAIGRIEQQVVALSERRNAAEAAALAAAAPLDGWRAELQRLLDRRVQSDQRLAAARGRAEAAQQAVRAAEQARAELEQAAQARRERREALLLRLQALRLKCERHLEALAALELEAAAVLAELPEHAELGTWEAQAVELEQRIRRLEPVNLAAVKELEELRQRKAYLDAQHADLTEALGTLEEAIRKIDRETRHRFKETFDAVNAGLQELFPRLFGGGHAYLELTGEDLLSTGVTVIARPPGKRPSSIALLSGGEKALTAVALVFAIFRLNPAPFCLLDEVDAPLDEVNVGRFGRLVREMSQSVQFVFVTHNKATMEIADRLCGVTMREAGVSRLVSVNLAEAEALAGAAA